MGKLHQSRAASASKTKKFQPQLCTNKAAPLMVCFYAARSLAAAGLEEHLHLGLAPAQLFSDSEAAVGRLLLSGLEPGHPHADPALQDGHRLRYAQTTPHLLWQILQAATHLQDKRNC